MCSDSCIKYNQKVVGYPHTTYDAIVRMSMSWQASPCVHSSVRLIIPVLPKQSMQHLLALWELASVDEASNRH